MTELTIPQNVNVTHLLPDLQTPVEFKITKTDLIETLIQDEEDRLYAIKEGLDKQIKDLQAERKALEEAAEAKVIDLAREALGARLVALEAANGEPLEVSAEGHLTVYLDENTKNRRYTDFINVTNRVKFSLDDDALNINLRVTLPIEKAKKCYDIPAIKKVIKACEPLSDQLTAVVAEINGLEKKGKRAKAQLVRDILERTEQGKQLLGQMNKAQKLYIDGKPK